jgi:hypothetical protein
MEFEFEEKEEAEVRRPEMNEEEGKKENLIDTTDCLEAIGVFRGWKNFLFIIAISCLVLLQVSFWLVDTGYVKASDEAKVTPSAVTARETEEIKKAAEQVTAEEQGEAIEAEAPQEKTGPIFTITIKHVAWLIRFCDFVLILVAALYCLAILFSLKVSLLGRLGGINHISRAFFLSLAFFVLLLPWQKFFGGVVVGAIYTPKELLTCFGAIGDKSIFGVAFYYLRFTGYWVIVLLLLIFSQFRSVRWSKAVLRRLEVI